MNAFTRIPEEYGGEERFCVGFTHTLSKLVPESYFDTHPEYFSLVNGVRNKTPGYQRCLTNPDVIQMTVERVKQEFRKYQEFRLR